MSDKPQEISEGERQNILTRGEVLSEGASKFPEVRGLCRNCSQAHITRRAYSEVPTVICKSVFDHPHRVPLDIKECTGFQRRGELTLYQMNDMAILIDERQAGGQYL